VLQPAEVLAKLQNLVPEASSKDPEVQFQAVKAVRKLLGFDGNLPIAIGLLKDSGILPILAECLKATSKYILNIRFYNSVMTEYCKCISLLAQHSVVINCQ